MFLPWMSGTFAYCIYMMIYTPDDSPVPLYIIILTFVLFIFYSWMISMLNFIDSNSIIKPYKFTQHWFTSFSFWYPYEIILLSMYSYQMINMAAHLLYFITTIVSVYCAFMCVYVFIHYQFVYSFSGEIYITKLGSYLIFSIFAAVTRFHQIRVGLFVIGFFPIVLIILLSVIHISSDYYRRGYQNLLSQIDSDIQRLSVNSLQQTLATIKRESSLICFVKEGILSGNKAIISDVFIQYCLETYPNSEWFISYVTCLYAMAWQNDSTVYKYILHLLSLDIFSSPCQLLLFQYVYLYMQTAVITSPRISRQISKFHLSTVRFVSTHKNFWTAALNHDLTKFYEASSQLFYVYLSLENQIKKMLYFYPFSAVVHAEASAFYADVIHDIPRADTAYREAEKLINNKCNEVANTIFKGFINFFPRLRETNQVQEEPKEYKFNSFFEHYENANRQGVTMMINDIYISSMMHTYTLPSNTILKKPQMKIFAMIVFLIIILLTGMIYIALIVFHYTVNKDMNDGRHNFNNLNFLLNETVFFRSGVNAAEFYLYLLDEIIQDPTDDFNSLASIKEILISILKYIDDNMLKYKVIIDEMNSFTWNINMYLDNCSNPNCSFTYLFAQLHESFLFFLNSKDYEGINDHQPIATLNSIIADIDEISQSIFEQFYVNSTNYLNLIHNQLKTKLLAMLCVEALIAIISSIACEIIVRSAEKNVFNIIRTAQPPILQAIANQFNKLLTFDQYQQPDPHFYKFPVISIPIASSFIPLFIFCFFFVLFFPKSTQLTECPVTLPRLIPVNRDTHTYFRSLIGFLDFLNDSTYSYWSYNYYFVTPCEECKLNDQFMKQVNTTIVIAVNIIVMIISFIGFCFYAGSGALLISLHRCGQILLRSLPNKAIQSNPVCAKLLQGQHVSYNDVKRFLESIHSPPKFDFFAILYYDEEQEITQITGDIESLISFTPTSVEELQTFILAHSPDDIDEVNKFFERRSDNGSISVSISEGNEISVMFGKSPDSIIIKNDSDQYEVNSKIRSTKNLNALLDSFAEKGIKSLTNAVVIEIGFEKESTLQDILQIADTNSQVIINDMRNNTIILYIPYINDEAKAAHACFEFLESIRYIFPEIQCAASMGSGFMFIDSMKNQTTKSRCISKVNSVVHLMRIFSAYGKPAIAKELFVAAQVDVSQYSFEDFTISSDTTVQILSSF